MTAQTLTDQQKHRQSWMGTLARASVDELETRWADHASGTDYRFLREPEIGLIMVRARTGGSGSRFNLGEMSISRCSVSLNDGTIGHGYVKGRSRRHAELIALFDAIFQQNPEKSDFVVALKAAQDARKLANASKVAATKVDFYTMVRGED